jgi:hypothetical protein
MSGRIQLIYIHLLVDTQTYVHKDPTILYPTTGPRTPDKVAP